MSAPVAPRDDATPPSRQFFVGLLGGGNISETHGRAAQAIPGVQIAAIHGVNKDKVTHLSREFAATPYFNLEGFLAHRPLDVVVIGSPSGLHAEQGIAAARRGLHVLTEKPIDISTARADELISAADRAKIKLGVLYQDRTKPHLRQLKTWLAEGIFGAPLLADARVKWYRPPEYYARSRWRGTLEMDGGGALINQGIHTVDLLLWLLGDVVRVQACKRTQLHKIEAEDTVAAVLEFANGAVGTFCATTAAYPGYPRRVEITGSEGTVALEHDRIVSAQVRDSVKQQIVSAKLESLAKAEADQNQSATSAAVSDFRGHQALLEDFLSAIEGNREPICSGREGRRSLALVEAIYRAAGKG